MRNLCVLGEIYAFLCYIYALLGEIYAFLGEFCACLGEFAGPGPLLGGFAPQTP